MRHRSSQTDALIGSLTIDGEPVPKGRPRLGRAGHVYTPPRTHEAEQRIAWLWHSRHPSHQADSDARYSVEVHFHCSTKRADVDNLLKLVLDALNGVAWADDAQVVHTCAHKIPVSRNEAHTELHIWEVSSSLLAPLFLLAVWLSYLPLEVSMSTPTTVCLYQCTYDDETPIPIEVGYLCRRCWHHLHRTLGDLAAAYGWLRTQMPRTSTPLGEKLSGTREPPAPVKIELLDHAILIADQLLSWTRLICEEHTPTLAGPRDTTPSAVAGWLRARATWIAHQPWIDEMLDELTETLRTAHALAPWRIQRRDLPVPCPHCDLLTLALYSGTDWIECRHCGTTLGQGRYQQWAHTLLTSIAQEGT